MKFNSALLRPRTSQLGQALADTLYLAYPGVPVGSLPGDGLPVAIMSLTGFQSNLAKFGSPWTLDSIEGVDPTQAIVAAVPDIAGLLLYILFMPPSQVGPWGPLVMQRLSYNCPNVGPIIPADFAIGQGVQYIAVMPDMSKVPCFESCCIQQSDQRPVNLQSL